MNNHEASTLLQHCAEEMTGTGESRSTPALLTTLDGLPLGIAQAGRFIKTLNVSSESYLQMYGSERREVMDFLSAEASLQDADKGSIRTTWNLLLKILLDKISKHETDSNNFSAYRLLQLFAYFHPSDLSFETLRRGLVGNWIPSWFRNTFTSTTVPRGRADSARPILDRQQSDRRSYSMHRVVHNWLCLYAACDPDPELLRLAVSAVLFGAPCSDQALGEKPATIGPCLRRLDKYDPLDFLVRFDKPSGEDLVIVTSMLHDEPKKAWQLMRFDYALGNILRLWKALRTYSKAIIFCKNIDRFWVPTWETVTEARRKIERSSQQCWSTFTLLTSISVTPMAFGYGSRRVSGSRERFVGDQNAELQASLYLARIS